MKGFFFLVICISRCTCQLDGTLWYFHTDRLIESAGLTVTITTEEKFSFGVQVTNFSILGGGGGCQFVYFRKILD